MSATIQVWSDFEGQAGATCFGALAPLLSASGTEATESPASLRVTVPREAADRCSLGEGRLLKVFSSARPTRYWFVTSVQDTDGDNGVVQITAGDLRQMLSTRGLVRSTAAYPTYEFTPGGKTPQQLITDYVLTNLAADGLTYLFFGSSEFTDTIDIGVFDRVNRTTILDRIEQQTGFDVELEQLFVADQFAGLYINVNAPPVAVGGERIMAAGTHFEALTRTRDALRGATVVVPFDSAGDPIRECVWKVTAISGTGPYTLTLADPTTGQPKPIREDDQLNGFNLVRRDGTTLAITDTFGSTSSVQVSSIGTLVANELVTVLTTSNVPVQQITSPSGLAGNRGRLVATVNSSLANVGRRQLAEDASFTDWSVLFGPILEPTYWRPEQASDTFTPTVAIYARNTAGSFTAKVSQAMQWDTSSPFVYKTLTFDNATANSYLYAGEIVSIKYTDGLGTSVSKLARVENTVRAASNGTGTLTIMDGIGGTPAGFDTSFIAGSIYSASSSGTVPAGTFDIVLLTPRPTFAANAAAPDVLRTGFRHTGGAAASKARIQNTKVKVFYYAPLPYLHFSVGCTMSALEPAYGLYSDTALVPAAVGLIEDTASPGTLLASANATGAPTNSATSTAQGPGNPWHVTQLTGTQSDETISGVYTMTTDKVLRLVLYPARCRFASLTSDKVLSAEASATTFWYNASLYLSNTTSPFSPVSIRSDSNTLWHRAQDVLATTGAAARYTLRGIDLEQLLEDTDGISLGQLLRVRSERLNLDATVRVIRLDFDLMDPERLNLELGAIVPRLTGVTVSL
jgi:hypothetical protein